MSTAATPQPEQPADHDWLDVADAVGVTPAGRLHGTHDMVPFLPHPHHRHEFADPALDAMVSRWATAHAGPACGTCQDTGVIAIVVWWSGTPTHVTCSDCGGDSA